MHKQIRMLTMIAVASVFLSASPASAQYSNPAYHTTFFSDSSHQTQVGYTIWTGCDAYNYPTYRVVGTYTQHTEDELIGYCIDGEMNPL